MTTGMSAGQLRESRSSLIIMDAMIACIAIIMGGYIAICHSRLLLVKEVYVHHGMSCASYVVLPRILIALNSPALVSLDCPWAQ